MTLQEHIDAAPLWRPTKLPPGPAETALFGVSRTKATMLNFAAMHPQYTVKWVVYADYRQDESPGKIVFETASGTSGAVVSDMRELAALSSVAKIFIACGDHTMDRWASGKAGRALASAGISGFNFGGVYKFNRSRFYEPSFFQKNKNRLEAVYSLLADELSRGIFSGLLKSRLTGDCGYIPVSSYEEYAHPALKITRGAVVVDGGVSDDLSETLKLSAKVGPDGLLVAFEPGLKAFETSQTGLNSRGVKNVRLLNLGLWHKKDALPFMGDGIGAYVADPAKKSGKSTQTGICQLVALDGYCLENGLTPDAIKLDVEGSELAALRGAEGIIRERKPGLIICLYHEKMDLLEIIEWLAGLQCNYRFFLGHHHTSDYDTVLYSIV
jgi:FkbM family methyltransferase